MYTDFSHTDTDEDQTNGIMAASTAGRWTLLIYLAALMLLGQTSGQTQLIHEVDGNDILVTIDTSSLRAAASQIQNLTNFFESKKFKLSNFYKRNMAKKTLHQA